MILQYSTDKGVNWQDMVYSDANFAANRTNDSLEWRGYTDTKSPHIHENALAVILTAEKNEMANSGGNTWEYVFKNLPSMRKVGNEKKGVIYRCVEVKVGSAEVAYPSDTPSPEMDTEYEAGPYRVSYQMLDENKTAVRNILHSTTLTVTKQWEGDQNNLYQSRPDSLTFKLQKKVKYDSGNSTPTWVDVLKPDETPYTFTLTKENTVEGQPDKWERTLEHLPVGGTDDNGTAFSLEFRAVELHANESLKTVQDAENYEDVTDYDTSHIFNTTDATNSITITNQLRTAGKSITAEKVWYTAEANPAATFELQYKKVTGEDEWHPYSPALTKTISKNDGTQSVTWNNLPTYDREGNELDYQIIEHPVDGYKKEEKEGTSSTQDHKVTKFTNIQLQSYTVTKTWSKPGFAYVPDNNGSFTSTFVLQRKVGNRDWEDCTSESVTLPKKIGGADVNEHTWTELPKYTADGQRIIYRAVETQINGNSLADTNGNYKNTDGNYIATYQYAGTASGNAEPAFDDTKTDATNRLVYGFVDLSKTAAYLASGGAPEALKDAENTPQKLSGIVFNILKKEGENYTSYATGIETDANGRLTLNDDGKTYGTQKRYLIPGTYKLVEASTQNDYSLWDRGVEFTVGPNGGTTDTGEHGTAWIRTDTTTAGGLTLAVSYLHPTPETTSHYFNDSCGPNNDSAAAYNLESRGVIEFTKTGPTGSNGAAQLDTHSNAVGEDDAYFGVYTDSDCTSTTQVAGMKAKSGDKTAFVLTDKAQDGTTSLSATNTAGIPYLRQYGGDFTLLSGTYYVKELVAPAGYKVDTTVRTVTIDRLQTPMDGTNLVNFYVSNKGSFTGGTANQVYQWPNTPNKVTIYKLDQFGRSVMLNTGGYLELKFDGEDKKFPTGEQTIRLYQDTGTPAKNANGTTQVGNGGSGAWSITYSNNAWTITGLFDMGKSYTLSEADNAAPDENIQAKPITFTIGGDGEMNADTSTDTHTKKKETGDITAANGAENDYKNYYQPNAENNQVVLRDVARFRKNVALKKVDGDDTATPKKFIPNISFNLFHKESETSWKQVNVKKVNGTLQETGAELTTDTNGVINLASLTDATLINSITGAPLSNGLDLGDYYFEEVEAGASDGYRLANKIYFSIVRVDNPVNPENYEEYAKVEFKLRSSDSNSPTVSQSGDQGTVENTPAQGKSLVLTKVDADGTTPLAGAKFELTYESINNDQAGAKQPCTTYAMTDATGALKKATVAADGSWAICSPETDIDISAKGTYTLTELRAPTKDSANAHGYSTYTTNGTTAIPVMLSFKVGSNNEITDVNDQQSSYILDAFTGTGLVETPNVTTGVDGDLTVTVKNNKTVVTIDKRSDVNNSTKTKSESQHNLSGETLNGAELEIYQGRNATGTPVWTNDKDQSTWTLTGVLSENTVYTLHEKTPPVGYLTANDLYFCLFGTRTVGTGSGSTTESQLYVWNGSGKPPVTVTPEALTVTTNWSKSRNLDADNDLTMVDEAIIAPVDARKVRKDGNASTPLAGVTFTVSVSGDGGAKLGTVVSGSDGHLTWQSLTDDAVNGPVYIRDGNQDMRITTTTQAEGKPVILQQNATGYTFTETYAPDNAYNAGESYQVKITDQNYIAYKAHSDWAIDLVEANKATGKTTNLTERSTTQTDNDLVNPAYRSTVKLFKYDSDPEAGSAATAGIAETEFTLYRGSETTTPYDKASATAGTNKGSGVFTTDASGNLSITIPEKGTYTLTETNAATGYSGTNSFTFTLADKAENGSFGYDTENELKPVGDNTGVPNARQYGTITLTKTDADSPGNSPVPLNGVVYTLARTDKTGYFAAGSQTVETGKAYIASYDDTGTPRTCTLTEDSSTAAEAGKIKISNLDWGTYTLTETTELSGYKIAASPASISFEIKQNQRSVSMPDTNTKNSVKFKKTEYDDSSKGLSGAVFEVHDAANPSQPVKFYPSAAANGEAAKVTRATSGSDGEVTIYGLPTDPSNNTPTTYKLVEVSAPAGYVKNPTPVTFTIDRQGNVMMGSTDVTNTNVPMADKPTRVTLEKKGETGDDLLTGAEYTLERTGETGYFTANPQTVTTGKSYTASYNSTTGKCTLTGTEQSGENANKIIMTGLDKGNYKLTETKAPDGYEATAVIPFTIGEDGRVTIGTTTGGHRYTVGSNETCCEAANVEWGSNTADNGATGEYESTLSIRDEKIRVKLTKVDRDAASTKLGGVTFTLTPYDTSSKFTPGFTDTRLSTDEHGVTTFTDTTATSGENLGVINIPDGLLVHGCKYLLQETATIEHYYLGKEAKDGVILNVAQDGSINVERLPAHNGKKVNTVDSCPVSASNMSGHVQLTAKNPKAAAFSFTKDVTGNMGDLTGEFTITMEVYEPDYQAGDDAIATQTVTLKNGESYSSVDGKKDKNGNPVTTTPDCKFASDSFPVGSVLKIIEDSAQDYKAKIELGNNANAELIGQNEQGVVLLRLNGDWVNPASFKLTNKKDVAIDVGVVLEQNAPYALIAIAIPALWLYLRARRRRKGGEE